MKQQLNVALAMMAGAVFLYCSQQGSNGPAGAQSGGGTCCTPPAPPAPVVLFDDKAQQSCRSTTAIDIATLDVAGYRSIVVHASNCRSINISHANGVAGAVRGQTITCDLDSKDALVLIDPKLGKQVVISGFVSDCNNGVAITAVGHQS